MKDCDKKYTFTEAHRTGGEAVITISRSQALDYMKSRQRKFGTFQGMSDIELVGYFVVNYCCEVADEYTK